MSGDGARTDHRKVYAKGFFDGLKAKGESMNAQKFQQKFSGMTAIAKKVYEATPISEAWKASQINSEIYRITRSHVEMRIMQGCLNTLIDAGLVRETEKGFYQREEVRDLIHAPAPVVRLVKDDSEPAKSKIINSAKGTPIELLGAVSSRIQKLRTELNDIASTVENIALDVEGQMEKNNTDTEKLRQLQQLLKSIGA